MDSGQIRGFTGNEYIKDIPKGDSWMIFGWSGDAVQLKADNPNIEFVLPESGGMLWTDNMQIPVGAPHAYTAEKFIDYVYQPEVQAPIEAYVNYICPVNGAKEVIAKTRQGARREPADLPGQGLPRQHAHLPGAEAGGGARAERRVPEGDRRVGAGAGGLARCRPGSERRHCRTCCSSRGSGGCCCSSRSRWSTWRSSRSRPAPSTRGFQLTWEFSNYTNALKDYNEQFIRSFEYAGLATLIALLIGYPLAYVIAFRGGQLAERAAAPGDRAVLRHVPDPHALVGDDPVRLGHRREHAQDARDPLGGRALARHHGLRGRGHHLQLPALHDPAAVREPGADRPAACWRRATTSTAAGATCSCA